MMEHGKVKGRARVGPGGGGTKPTDTQNSVQVNAWLAVKLPGNKKPKHALVSPGR